jgi:hypothetical protein
VPGGTLQLLKNMRNSAALRSNLCAAFQKPPKKKAQATLQNWQKAEAPLVNQKKCKVLTVF